MIDVELHRADLATVTITPPIVRRVLFGARTVERFAVRTGSSWCWDSDGRLVNPRIAEAIEREARRCR